MPTNQLLKTRKNYNISLKQPRESVKSQQMTEEPKDMRELILPELNELRVYCRGLVKKFDLGPKVADDLFQDVIMRAIKYQKGFFEGDFVLAAWLKSIAYNRAIDLVNKKNKEAAKTVSNTISFGGDDGDEVDIFEAGLHKELQGNSAEAEYMDQIDDERIKQALESLDDEFKEALRLNMIEGLEYSEIAERLGIPVNTVGTRIYRGRTKLREILAPVAAEYGIGNKDKKK